MIINKKLTLIKYNNEISFDLTSESRVIRAYKIINGSWQKYDSFMNYIGLSVDFTTLENGNYYLLITSTNASFDLDVGNDTSTSEVINNTLQLSLYKGDNVNVSTKTQISRLYYLSGSSWNNNWITWNRSNYNIGLDDDYALTNGSIYLLRSVNTPYVFWSTVNALLTENSEYILTEENNYLITEQIIFPNTIYLQGWGPDQLGKNINGTYVSIVGPIGDSPANVKYMYKHISEEAYVLYNLTAQLWQHYSDDIGWYNPSSQIQIPLNGWIIDNAVGTPGSVCLTCQISFNNIPI